MVMVDGDGVRVRISRAVTVHAAVQEELGRLLEATRLQLQHYVRNVAEFDADVRSRRAEVQRLALNTRDSLRRKT